MERRGLEGTGRRWAPAEGCRVPPFPARGVGPCAQSRLRRRRAGTPALGTPTGTPAMGKRGCLPSPRHPPKVGTRFRHPRTCWNNVLNALSLRKKNQNEGCAVPTACLSLSSLRPHRPATFPSTAKAFPKMWGKELTPLFPSGPGTRPHGSPGGDLPIPFAVCFFLPGKSGAAAKPRGTIRCRSFLCRHHSLRQRGGTKRFRGSPCPEPRRGRDPPSGPGLGAGQGGYGSRHEPASALARFRG